MKTRLRLGWRLLAFGLVLFFASPRVTAQEIDVPKIKAQAEAGNAKAQNVFGAMFNLGQGVKEDHTEAVKWFRKAADQGEMEAFYNLGTMYLNGRGVAKDATEAVKWIHRAAQKGFAVAQFALGAMCQQGSVMDKDLTGAANWYFLAAEQGHTEAQFSLGMMYFQAQGVPQDYVSAFTLFSLAANKGLEKASEARELVSNLLAPEQVKEGLRRVAVFKPKPPTAVALPKVELPQGRAVKALESKAPPAAPPATPDPKMEELKVRAAKGDAAAQFDLGMVYQAGREVTQDFAEAAKWFTRAAQQGHGKARRYLGSLYFQGRGVTQDFVTAYKWLDLAAGQKVESAADARDLVARLMTPEQLARAKQLVEEFQTGKPAAPVVVAPVVAVQPAAPKVKATMQPATATNAVTELLNRGQRYATGKGVPQDLAEAARLFRQAAEQGNAEAQATLGIMYLHGRGVKQDKPEAAKWLNLAADQHHAPAQFWLGMANEKLADVDRAALYRQAAEQGYGPAQYYLATFYAAGQGVPQDYIEAYKWFTLSADNGQAQALTVRETTAQFMTPEQIAEAKQRAAGFVPRPPAAGSGK